MLLKVLGVCASPRLNGNSDLLLRQALSGAEQTGAVVQHPWLCDHRINTCTECYACSTTGECVMNDDYQTVLDKMLEADRIIFATPVFSLTVSAQAKILIDRGQCLWVRKNVFHRPLFEPERDRRGMIIAVGGSRGKRQVDCVRRPIQSYLQYLEVDYVGGLFVNQVDEKGAILKRPQALQQAFRLGRELAGSRGPRPNRPVHIKLL